MQASDVIGKAMSLANAAATLPGLREAKQWPPVQRLRAHLHWKHFLSPEGHASHYGAFTDFDHARGWLPRSPGFNQPELAREYREVRMHRLYDYDRPVVAVLRRAFDAGIDSVLDLGGSIGVHFHAYRPHIDYPPTLRWTVYEVPAMCEVGREVALQEHADALVFTDCLDGHALASSLWMSSGALHYMEHVHLGDLLETTAMPPRHVVLNKLPLHAGDTFVSAQNIGERSYVPHYVYNRDEFIAGIENAGYRLRHEWAVPERSFYLPGHPERSFDAYTGLHFTRRMH